MLQEYGTGRNAFPAVMVALIALLLMSALHVFLVSIIQALVVFAIFLGYK